MKTKRAPLTFVELCRHPRVAQIDDERLMGNGILITLKQGWSFDQLCDNRVRGEDTPAEALRAVKAAHAFAGPFTD